MGAFDDALGTIDKVTAPPAPAMSPRDASIPAGTPRVIIGPNAAKSSSPDPFSSAIEAIDSFKPKEQTQQRPPADDATPAGFTRRFEAVGPVDVTSNYQKLNINNENEMASAAQHTTPNIASHQKNYISSDVFQNDAGESLYRDLDTGELKPTDENKHVILRDPQDNRLKVFARDDNTNEGMASAVGRVLRLGMTSSAPTAAATDAAVAAPLITGTKAIPKGIAPGQEVANAAERIGVDLPRVVTSDNPGTQFAGKLASNVPFAGTPLRKASEKAIGQLGQAGTEIEQGFGGGSIPAAGASMRSGIENYIGNTTKARQNSLYEKVDKLVDNTKTVDLAATRDKAQTILSRRENAAITETSSAVKKIEDAVTRPGGLNYDGVKTLRTYIGEMMEGRSPLPSDVSQAELKQIYKGLSDDLRVAARRGGGEKAVEAFDRANNYTKLVSDRRENLMRILGAKSDEGVFDKLAATAGSTSRADLNLLRQARKAVTSESWNELASGVISRLGRAPNGDFSPDRFSTAFGKLSPQAKTLLFRTTGRPELANALDDISKVSERFKELNKFANPSGTGQHVIGAAEIAWIIHDPITALATITTGRVVSHILSVPKTAESTAKWAKAYELAVTKPSQATIESFRQASKVLASNIGRETSRADLIPELANRLQNAATARADQDQNP